MPIQLFHENQVPWPAGRPICASRKNGPFRTNMSDASSRVLHEVSSFTRAGHSWRTKELWIFADAKLGAAGRFLANQPGLHDPRVAVRFDLDGKDYQIVADRYYEPWQNLAGIAEYIKAIRAQERNGIFTVGEMMASFAALPPMRKWFAECWDEDRVTQRFRELSKTMHPDVGGDPDTFQQIVAEKEFALDMLGRLSR